MKFQRDWLRVYNDLPPLLQEQTLCYKQWKKMIKFGHVDLLCKLQMQVRKLGVFIAKLEKDYHKVYMFQCFRQQTHWNKHDIITFLLLNKTTLYKICKKISKKNKTMDAMKYLENTRKSHVLGERFLTFLQTTPSSIECPICLENKEQYFIYDCGHLMCMECFVRMNHVKYMRGTLRNAMTINSKYWIKCPMCRESMHVYDIKKTNTYPISLIDKFQVNHGDPSYPLTPCIIN